MVGPNYEMYVSIQIIIVSMLYYPILVVLKLFSSFRKNEKEQRKEEKEERKMKRNLKQFKWYVRTGFHFILFHFMSVGSGIFFLLSNLSLQFLFSLLLIQNSKGPWGRGKGCELILCYLWRTGTLYLKQEETLLGNQRYYFKVFENILGTQTTVLRE